MKIAYCLYGQPRKLYEGYQNISTFTKKYNVDFYYHTWYDESIEYYDASPWRNISQKELKVKKDTIKHINNLYKPVAYLYDKPISFDISKYNYEKNFENILSQLYSRNKVRNLLKNSGINYDLVIMSRFDFLRNIGIDLNNIDINKTYVSNLHYPRKILPDNFFVMNYENFIKMFDIYEKLSEIIDNDDVKIKMKEYDEKCILNLEEIILMKYIYEFNNVENVVYTNLIPNFI